MNETYTEALKWLMQGIAVIPLGFRSKEPCYRRLPRDKNGRPIWGHLQTQLPTVEDLNRWFDHYSPMQVGNLGVVCGWQGLTVLDFDEPGYFFKWWERFRLQTRMVMTSRGVHVYLFITQPVPSNMKKLKVEGLTAGEIKAAGGYVMVPPSIHPNGQPYQVLCDAPILRVSQVEDVLSADWLTPSNAKPEAVVKAPIPEAEPTPLSVWEKVDRADKPLIAEIKQRVNILDFFPDAVPSGNGWYMAWCPFHPDEAHNHSRSLRVNPRLGICNCFVCEFPKPLDVINLAAFDTGSIDEAIRKLARML